VSAITGISVRLGRNAQLGGKTINPKTDAIIFDGVIFGARYAKCRRFCPWAIYPYWREVRLERAETNVSDGAPAATQIPPSVPT
jgi:hypothetical protein